MDWGLDVTVFAFALAVGFLSGLLGIGGGILMTPLLLYGPPLFGVGEFSVQEVTGLTIVLGLLASASGVLRHRAYGFVSQRLVLYMGVTIALASLTGAILSRFTAAGALLAILACLALVAAVLMLLPPPKGGDEALSFDFRPSRARATAVAAGVGFLGGMVGLGGAFILVPFMIQVLRVPTRLTIGSSLGIVFFSALAGFAGKAGTGQIPLAAALALALGAIPGAQLGGYASPRVRPALLRQALALIIVFAAARMWADVLA